MNDLQEGDLFDLQTQIPVIPLILILILQDWWLINQLKLRIPRNDSRNITLLWAA